MGTLKLAITAALLMCFCGGGCPPPNPLSPFVGTWTQTSTTVNGQQFPDDRQKMTFNADGTANWTNPLFFSGGTFLVNWQATGSQLTLLTDTLVGTIVYEYVISGNTLSLTSSKTIHSFIRE